MNETSSRPRKPHQGFQTMTPERRREIAAMGGRAAQARGTAHRYDSEEAREAGRKRALKHGQQLRQA